MSVQTYVRALPALCIIRYVAGMLSLLMLMAYLAHTGSYLGLVPLVPYSGYLVYAFYLVLRALRDDTGHYQSSIGMNLYLMDINYVVLVLILLMGPLAAYGPLAFLLLLHAEFNTSFVAAVWIEMKLRGQPELLDTLMDPASYHLVKNSALTAKTCAIGMMLLNSNPHMVLLFFGYLVKPCTLLAGVAQALSSYKKTGEPLMYTPWLTLAEVLFYAACSAYRLFQFTNFTMAIMALSVASNHLIPDFMILSRMKTN